MQLILEGMQWMVAGSSWLKGLRGRPWRSAARPAAATEVSTGGKSTVKWCVTVLTLLEDRKLLYATIKYGFFDSARI